MKAFRFLLLIGLAAPASLHAQDRAAADRAPGAAVVAQTRPTAPLAAVVDARLFVVGNDQAGARDARFQPRPNRPRSALRGAVIGGLVTGTAAVVSGLVSSRGSCEENLCYIFYPYLFAVAAVPGVVLGGLVGWNLPDDEEPASTDPASQRR